MDEDKLAVRRHLEGILGFSLNEKPTLPGLEPVPGRGFLYVEVEGADIDKQFLKVNRAHAPLLAKYGSVMNENWTLTTPEGVKFYAVSFFGDLYGWREQITRGAQAMGLRYGSVEPPSFVDSVGGIVLLSDCATENW